MAWRARRAEKNLLMRSKRDPSMGSVLFIDRADTRGGRETPVAATLA
jgi:hypothetical protein